MADAVTIISNRTSAGTISSNITQSSRSTGSITVGGVGPGVAPGGTVGQVLVKNSSSNYDTSWSNGVTADATTTSKGKIQLAGDLSGTAGSPTVPGLATKAPLASPALTGAPTAPTAAPATNTTQLATTAFVGGEITGAAVPDATTGVRGKVQLAGDLGGTATVPLTKSRTIMAVVAKSGTADFVCSNYVSDAACIQAANDFLVATYGYGLIWLRLGTYSISATVNLSPGIGVVGEGYGSIVQLSAPGTMFKLVDGASTGHLVQNDFEDLHFEGGGFSNVKAIDCGAYGQEINVKNCRFYNFGGRHATTSSYCIYASGTNKKLQIMGNFFGDSGNGNDTPILLGGAGDVTIIGNDFHDFWDAIHGNSEKTQIVGNDIYNGDNIGIYLGTAVGGLQVSNIVANTISNVSGYGIRIGQTAGKGTNITGNFFRNIDLNAIWLRGAYHTVIGNYFQDIAQTGAGADAAGITLNDGCQFIKVVNNTVVNAHTNMTYGIAPQDTATGDNWIRGNSVTGAQVADIRITSASTNSYEGDHLLTLESGAAFAHSLGRNSDTSQSGFNYTIQAGGVASKATNKAGGSLVLRSGQPTGSGTGSILFQTATPATTTLGTVSGAAINARGSGYTVSDVLTLSGGTGATVTVSTVAAAGSTATVALNAPGSGYTDGDVLTLSGGGGNATIKVRVGSYSNIIQSVSIVSAGTGYSTVSGVATTGGTGTGATFDIAIYATGAILSAPISGAGSGYSLTTAASVTGGTGTGATFDITPFDNIDTSFASRASLDSNGFGMLGYGRIGSLSAPNNTTAGDLTATRLAIGNTALSTANGQLITVTGTLTDTASGATVGHGLITTVNPGSNSSAEFRTTNFSARGTGASNISTLDSLYSDTRQGGSGNVTLAQGSVSTGIVVTNTSYAGTISTANGLSVTAASQSGNPTGGVITNAKGLLVNDSSKGSGGLAITNQFGVDIATQTQATTLNVGLRIAAPSGATNNYALQLSDTGATAAGGLTFGTDTQLYRSAAAALTTNATSLFIGGGLYPDGTAARTIGGDSTNMRAASGAGVNLTLQAGGAQSGSTDQNGGAAIVAGGVATGNGGSNVSFYTTRDSQGSGTTDRTPAERMRLSSSNNGRLILGTDFTQSVDGITMVGTVARAIQSGRHITANTAGNALTIKSGGATSAASNKSAGNLILQTGLSTGSGTGNVQIQVTQNTAASTTDNALTTVGTFALSNLTLADPYDLVLGTTTGTKIGTATTQLLGFYNAIPIAQVAAATDLGVALSNLGLRAAGTAWPLTTTGNASFGSVTLGTAGNKLSITTGSNASAGTGTLTGGTVTISTTAVTASSLIFLTDTASSITNVGTLTVSAKSAGTSFTVTSTLALDTSTFNWLIIN